MELVGEKIRLRPVDSSDLADLFRWWNDPEFNGKFSSDFPRSMTEIEELVKLGSFFMILGRVDGRKVGFISHYQVRADYPYLYEIGYRIRPDERGHGYTTEAAKLPVGHIFNADRSVERIESLTDVENVPSKMVLEKTGFTREGKLRKRAYNRGEYRDEYVYTLLREEWERPKE